MEQSMVNDILGKGKKSILTDKEIAELKEDYLRSKKKKLKRAPKKKSNAK